MTRIRLRRAETPVATLLALSILWGAGAVKSENAGESKRLKQSTEILAPGWRDLTFAAPVPSSYDLPIVKTAVDATLVTTDNRTVKLFDLLGNKVGIVSFIYTHCDDVNGCPLATFVLSKLARKIAKAEDLADRVSIVSISFDPERDSPERLETYSTNFRTGGSSWAFTVPPSEGELSEILAAYNQTLTKDPDGDRISHILRVFLIDGNKNIRNIYSVSFLHPDTLLSDIRTVLDFTDLTEQGVAVESSELKNEDRSETEVSGTPLNFARFLSRRQLGLPSYEQRYGEVPNPDLIALGRELFFDRRLSKNQTVSCAICHIPAQGFTSNELSTSVGVEGKSVKRNAPSLLNVGYLDRLFHDARESRLEQQIWSPLLATTEMGNPSVGFVLERILETDDYEEQFKLVFGGPPTMESLGSALAAYQRSLSAGNSRFDRWYFGSESGTMTNEEISGFKVFTGKGRCVTCHTIDNDHALFTDQRLHNTGIGYRRSMLPRLEPRRVPLQNGNSINVSESITFGATETPENDLGRYEVTQNPSDRWAFRTPSLRNVGLTAPYMHDGSIRSLKEVVDFYNAGGEPHDLLDAAIQPLELRDDEIEHLIAFLHSLTGESVPALIKDANNVEVGERR